MKCALLISLISRCYHLLAIEDSWKDITSNKELKRETQDHAKYWLDLDLRMTIVFHLLESSKFSNCAILIVDSPIPFPPLFSLLQRARRFQLLIKYWNLQENEPSYVQKSMKTLTETSLTILSVQPGYTEKAFNFILLSLINAKIKPLCLITDLPSALSLIRENIVLKGNFNIECLAESCFRLNFTGFIFKLGQRSRSKKTFFSKIEARMQNDLLRDLTETNIPALINSNRMKFLQTEYGLFYNCN